MSKGELWRGVAISLVVAVAFSVIGYHIIHYALEMVGAFGEDLGADERSRLIYAESHRWVHLFAAACGLALGVFYQRRDKTLFRLALVAIIACGSYGIQNMYGFSVKNRVSVAAVKTDDKASANRQYENARKDLQDQIGWLQRMSTQEEGRERRRLLAEVDAKRRELSALKPPVVTANNAFADTSAEGLAVLTHIDSRFWIFVLPLVLAVLMFLGESFSFVVVGHMLSGIVAMFAAYWATGVQPLDVPPDSKRKPRDDDDADGGHGDRRVQPQDTTERRPEGVSVHREAAPVQHQDSTVTVSSDAPGVQAPAPSITGPRTSKQVALDYLLANSDTAHASARAISQIIGVSKSTVAKAMREIKGDDRGRLGRVERNQSRVRGVRIMKGEGGGVQLYAH